MGLKWVDRAKMTTTTTGTGTITLGSAVAMFLSFASAGVANADSVHYLITDYTSGAWEIGTGVYTSSGTTLSRTLISSSSGALLNLSGGTVHVAVTSLGQDHIPSGTRATYQQTSAPTGWTKDTSSTYNDVGTRLTTGTVGTGGSSAFTTVFGLTATDSHTLTSPGEIPGHTHAYSSVVANVPTNGAAGKIPGVGTGANSTSTGSDGGHTHGIDLRVKYADLIVATKD